MLSSDSLSQLFDPKIRKIILRENFGAFFFWYFTKYFSHKTPDFHYEMYRDLENLGKDFNYLVWVMYRESAKTAMARAHAVWSIVFKKKQNIFWIGHDLKKAEKNARAIANQLQGNKRFIRDFGQLYYENMQEKRKKSKTSKPKKVSQFKAENGVIFTSSSTDISLRGELEEEFRPDMFYFDDIENDKTKKSVVVTKKIIYFIEETISGASVDADFIFLCNYISKYGVVQNLINKANEIKEWNLRMKSLIENGKITWPEKYVFSRTVAERINSKIINPKERIQSIDAKREAVGSIRFSQEFLNEPMTEGDRLIKEEWFNDGQRQYSRGDLFFDKDGGLIYRSKDGNKRLQIVAGIDPAISTKKTADDRAMVTIASFSQKIGGFRENIYLVLSSIAGKWAPSKFTNHIKKERDKFNTPIIGVESNAIQEMFRQYFDLHGINTVPLNPKGDKVERMMKNIADIEFQRVFFPDDGTTDELIHELISFTGESGAPDNRVDAFNYAMELCKNYNTNPYVDGGEQKTISGGILNKSF